MCETGCLTGVAVQAEREVVPLTHERTFLRWFREVHDYPLAELPLASPCHACRCGKLYMRKIYVLIMITGYIWNQGTLLNVWYCAAG
jgi:hypothetical protein